MSSAHLSLALLDGSPPPSLGEALVRAGRLVSDRVGVVSEVVFQETTPEEPAVYWAQSHPAQLGPLSGRATLNHGNATSVDADRATMKAVGETIERYSPAFYDEDQLVFASWEETTGRALRPDDFALFSARQYAMPGFPFAPFGRQTPIRWISGHSLLNDCATWVPASSVYIPYECTQGESALDDLISTGLACGTSYAGALLRALSEVVEREGASVVLAGLSTAERLCRRGACPGARVVTLTREMGPDTLMRAEALGVSAALRAPTSAARLEAVLGPMLGAAAEAGTSVDGAV